MDFVEVAQILTTLGAGGVLGMVVKAWIDKPKRAAEVKKARIEAQQAEKLGEAKIADLFAATAGKLVEAQNLQINELQKDFAGLKADNAGLICEIGRLEGKIDALEDQVALKNDEAVAMQKEIRALRRRLEAKDQEMMNLEAENTQLRERISELERKLEKLVGKNGS